MWPSPRWLAAAVAPPARCHRWHMLLPWHSRDSLPEWSKGVDSSSTSASCVGSNPTAVIHCSPLGLIYLCTRVCIYNTYTYTCACEQLFKYKRMYLQLSMAGCNMATVGVHTDVAGPQCSSGSEEHRPKKFSSPSCGPKPQTSPRQFARVV